ncbi:Eco57I restriction-modification methylase domain-containing protein [Haloarchaeobius sp. TZWWS8]|uniref:Eco57I restriction-modification methylase domain-containing protein n=1 Tax=Haloarchaeobius sp. TZWWS8 TaxID=3446121 RepID=UPI003EB85032
MTAPTEDAGPTRSFLSPAAEGALDTMRGPDRPAGWLVEDALAASDALPREENEIVISRVLVCRLAAARGLVRGTDWTTENDLPERLDAVWEAVAERVPTDPLPLDSWPAEAALAEASAQLDTVGDTGRRRDFAGLDAHLVGTVHEAHLRDERKATGAYYTPGAVVDYVVESTVAPLADSVLAGDRPLDDIAVVDPAMGCGRFLVAAVEALRDRLATDTSASRSLDESATRPASESASAHPVLTDELVANVVYGVDLDAAAVDLATLVCWLETGAGSDALAGFHRHLAVGDALVGRGGEGDARRTDEEPPPPTDHPVLDWSDAFPDVVRAGRRFDAAIGNPPYVRSRHISDPVKAYYREAYSTVTGAFDLYVAFVERAATLAGSVAFVVPNKWTTTRYGRPLRDQLLDRHRVVELVDLSSLGVFHDAGVYPVVLRFEAGAGPTDAIPVRRPADATSIGTGSTVAIPRQLVDRLGDRVVPTDLSADAVDLVTRLAAAGSRLGDHATASEGVHTGNVREKLLSADPQTDGSPTAPVVGGDDVSPYLVAPPRRHVRTDTSLVDREAGEYADLRDPDLFAGPKLLVPDVANRPFAAYDPGDTYALNSLYVVRPRPASDWSTWALCGLLNARLVGWFFGQVYGGSHVNGGYLRCKPMFLAEIPVPDTPSDSARRALASAARDASRAREARRAIAPQLEPDFENIPGRTLREHGAVRLAEGPLAATGDEFDGLRVGRVSVERTDDGVTIHATARYKPTEDGTRVEDETTPATDSWGFVETESVAAVELQCPPETAEQVVALVPLVTARGDGFGGFRRSATATISPLDRLLGIRIPDGSESDELEAFVAASRRARELDQSVLDADRRVDDIVYELYGLTEEEIEVVESAVGDD